MCVHIGVNMGLGMETRQLNIMEDEKNEKEGEEKEDYEEEKRGKNYHLSEVGSSLKDGQLGVQPVDVLKVVELQNAHLGVYA